MDIQYNQNNQQKISYFQYKTNEAEICLNNFIRYSKSLLTLSYNRGSRKEDFSIRDLVNGLIEKIESYHRKFKILDLIKSGDIESSREILSFFENESSAPSSFKKSIDQIREIIDESKRNDEKAAQVIDESKYANMRTVNIYHEGLLKDLNLWEKNFKLSLLPAIKYFLNIINEINFFLNINHIIEKVKIKNDEAINQLFYDYLKFIVKNDDQIPDETKMKKKLTRIIEEIGLTSILQDNNILNDANIDGILHRISNDMRFFIDNEKMRSQKKTKKLAEHIANKDIDESGYSEDPVKNSKKVLHSLCTIESQPPISSIEKYTIEKNLQDDRLNRYHFSTAGDYSESLNYTIDKFREILIFVYKWLYQELARDSSMVKFLSPIVKLDTEVENFIVLYRLAYETSSQPGNQIKTKIFSEEKHFITKTLAKNIITSIENLGLHLKEAFIASTVDIIDDNNQKGSAIAKRIVIIKDDFFSSFSKIKF